MARPTLYRAEYAGKALALCRLGVDKPLLARFFAVSTATLYHWLLAHPDLAAAVEAGAAEATSPTKLTLFQRATGYQSASPGSSCLAVAAQRQSSAIIRAGCSPTRRWRSDGCAIVAPKNGVLAIRNLPLFLKRQVTRQCLSEECWKMELLLKTLFSAFRGEMWHGVAKMSAIQS